MYDVIIISERYLPINKFWELKTYIKSLQLKGKSVFCPSINLKFSKIDVMTNFSIIKDIVEKMGDSLEVHLFLTPDSFKNSDCLFQLGSAFSMELPLVLINPQDLEENYESDSFENFVAQWSLITMDGGLEE